MGSGGSRRRPSGERRCRASSASPIRTSSPDSTRERVAQSVMPELRRAYWDVIRPGPMPWTIVAFPTPAWAEQVFGEPDVARLWDAIRSTVRLDEPDPVAAWARARRDAPGAGRPAERARVRRRPLPRAGDGPDASGCSRSRAGWPRGRRPPGAIPTTEPADRGGLHDSRPAADRGARPVDAAAGADRRHRRHGARDDVLERDDHRGSTRRPVPTRSGPRSALDDGASLLGEVALVDDTSRVGRSGITFWSTLFDENAASPHRLRHGDHACGRRRPRPRPRTRSRRWESTTRRPIPTS